jgi:FlaA1/EpsC-like NDP-sugar epimerase
MTVDRLRHRVLGVLLKIRKVLVIVVQLALVVAANQLAFLLRFDGQIPNWAVQAHLGMLPWLVAMRGLVFFPFKLYEGLWRYASFYDLRSIVFAVLTSSAIFAAVAESPWGVPVYPRSIFAIDALLLICFLAGLRLIRRLHRELVGEHPTRSVLIYGAGDAGERIVHDMKMNPRYGYEPVGFVDDDSQKSGLRIHGIPVLGTRDDLASIVARLRPKELLIAIPRAEAEALRGVLKTLEQSHVKISTLPHLTEIIDGRVAVGDIRDLRVEDLLNRAPIGLDASPVRNLIRGRRVMVTGAGGSIGSELCRQIAAFRPSSLVLFERYENGLYAVANLLHDAGHRTSAVPVIGDVTDRARLRDILSRDRPEIVFHAAAHKHVPLMEENPCEAVKNNIYGTRLLAEMAEAYGVDRFIFISTDKAVNPTSVMGASKRVAELVVQSQAQGSCTSFFTVRFGNVLGSNGSVVPRFIDQVKAGGPVTITHPEMRRFFMLIPEAVQLVLHAAAQGRSGETYVLEMGEQVKLVDMARNLIRLSGHTPDGDIPIKYIGLRPGEKLFEELVGEDELVSPSGIEKIMQVRPRQMPTRESLLSEVVALETCAFEGRRPDLLRQLASIVPAYATDVAAAPTASRLEYVIAEPDAEAETDLSEPAAFHQTCPVCHGTDVHRSRTRSLAERLRKSMTHERLFRCHACGWRGWQLPQDVIVTGQAPQNGQPDLAALDAASERDRALPPVAFSPRSLN